MKAVDDLLVDDRTRKLSLCTLHMVDQLNQDPHADSMVVSGRGTVIMEEGRTDIAGDEEVEIRDEGLTTGAATDTEAGDLVWDPQDLLLEFNDDNLGVAQTPVAALAPVVVQIEDEMPNLEDADPRDPHKGTSLGAPSPVPPQ